MTNEYEVKKMYFCKYNCPLKNNFKQYIQDTFHILIDEYEFEFTEDTCKTLCPVDNFISEL